MRLNKLFVILLCLISFTQLSTLAQPILVYEPSPPTGMNEEEYIASLLAGDGVVIENVARICDDDAFGVFRTHPNNTPTPNFGISEGVLLTTGSIAIVPGPSTGGGTGTGLGTPGDVDLTVLSGVATNDACVLEFDITPIGNVLSFYYIFGSEEYNEYVCSSVNDIFGFLITGPDPLGGNYTKENIALIPGTNIPVSINTLNNGSVGTNGSISTTPCDISNSEFFAGYIPELEYDGITDTLRAEIAVIPCQTYRLKLAIADGGDSAFDSGVFLQAGSFASPTPDLALSGGYETFVVDDNGDFVLDNNGLPIPQFIDSKGNTNGYIVEDCISKELTFSIDNLEIDAVINLAISGTATNGVDYYYLDDDGNPTPIPTNITLTSDTPTITYNIFAPQDNNFELTETIIIEILGLNSVNCILGATSAIDTIRIFDNILEYAEISTSNLGPFCPNTTVILDVFGGEQYEWFPAEYLNDPTSDEPVATITEDVTFGVILTNGPCTDTLYLDEMTVYETLPAVEPEYALCNEMPIELQTSNGSNFQWSPADHLSCTSCPNPIFTPTGENEAYAVTFFNTNGCFAEDSVQIVYDNPSFLTFVNPEDSIIVKCPEDNIEVELTGNVGGITYEWLPIEGLSCTDCPNPIISIQESKEYTVRALTQQGCEDMKRVMVEVNEFSANAGVDQKGCTEIAQPVIGLTTQQENYIYQWSPATGLSDSNIAQPVFEWSESDGLPFYEEYTLTITDTVGCQVTDQVVIEITGNPTVATNADSVVIFAGQGANLSVSGASTYSWSPARFLSNSTNEFVTARPDTTMMFMVEGTDENNCKNSDEIKVVVNNPPRIIAPSAFSPNNDGIHDEFIVLSKDIELVSLKVFNRWGEMVYENLGNLNEGWDGRFEGVQQGMGVYLYFAEYRFIGEEESEVKLINGNVTLIR